MEAMEEIEFGKWLYELNTCPLKWGLTWQWPMKYLIFLKGVRVSKSVDLIFYHILNWKVNQEISKICSLEINLMFIQYIVYICLFILLIEVNWPI